MFGRLNKEYYSSLIDAGGCRSLALGYARNTGVLNTLVTGGRCNNEQPIHYQKEFVFDFDLSSCYGSALMNFKFPIGLPTVYAKTYQDPNLTLKEFLDLYEDCLVDNLYTITVSGKLSFEQDLIYSKIVDEKKLSEKILTIISENTEDEIDVIDDGVSKVVLLRKEIIYGIITSDILKALRKICSNLELAEILKLKVETAIYYSNKNYLENKDLFLKQLKEKPGTYKYSIENQTILDNRSRFWTSIELKDFIGPLLDKRKKLKTEMNETSITPEEKFQLNGQQQTLKLLVNTLYGVFCSPYFSVSNTILANCITARARLGVWMASRPLKGIQCITDGFAYSPTDVFQLKNANSSFKKPGLQTLSNLELLKNNFYVKNIYLGNIDWKNVFLNNNFHENTYYQNLDQNVEEHLTTFWKCYDLSIPYKVEHKKENTGLKMVYFKRAHYAIMKMNGDILYKFRGMHENSVKEENPTFFKLSEALLKEVPKFQLDDENTVFKTTELNTINDYFMSLKRIKKRMDENIQKKCISNIESEDTEADVVEILIPGFPRVDKKEFHYNLSDMPALNYKMYRLLENKILDEDVKGKPYPIFHKDKYEVYLEIRKKYEEKR